MICYGLSPSFIHIETNQYSSLISQICNIRALIKKDVPNLDTDALSILFTNFTNMSGLVYTQRFTSHWKFCGEVSRYFMSDVMGARVSYIFEIFLHYGLVKCWVTLSVQCTVCMIHVHIALNDIRLGFTF